MIVDNRASDDRFTREQRDAVLVPLFYRPRFRNYMFLDGSDLYCRTMQKVYGVDTIAWSAFDDPIPIEEKIVRHVWGRLCLETMSCTNPGHERPGWMVYSRAHVLLFCMKTEHDDLLCYLIKDFQQLKRWFWPREKSFKLHVEPDTPNHSASRLVPVDKIKANVPTERFLLKRDACGVVA